MTRQVHIITAVANPLPQRSIDQILSSLDQWGVGVASGRWLGKKEAWEVPVDLGSLSAQAAADSLRKVLHNVDFAVTLDSPYRRKRLLCADMDSTMVQGETLDEVANMLGIGEKVAAITTRAMRGEIDFAEALMDRVAMLKGIGIDAFQAVLDNIKMSEGAKTLVATMKHLGAHCVLVTGGFDVVAQPVADMLGFNQTVANQLVQRNGQQVGVTAVKQGQVGWQLFGKGPIQRHAKGSLTREFEQNKRTNVHETDLGRIAATLVH